MSLEDRIAVGVSDAATRAALRKLSAMLPESGANANGHWLRLPDGTQMCWGNVLVTPVANVATLEPWTFPQPFISGDVEDLSIQATASSSSATVQNVAVVGQTTTGVNAVVVRTNTTNTGVRVFAIGRWR